MSQDLSGYTTDYYYRDIPETWFWRNGLLRPDQLAALCYTLGWPFWGREGMEPRDAGMVLSFGSGRGELEIALAELDQVVVAVDPSPGAQSMYGGQWFVLRSEWTPEMVAGADTIIFCEAVEHIPADELDRIRGAVVTPCRIIVVNWPDYHPIIPDGSFDHITLIDDAWQDRWVGDGRVVVRRQSHLVVDV